MGVEQQGQRRAFLKRYDEALAAYDRALALDPKYAFAWNNKGIALRALGREAEAQEAERHARLRYGSARCGGAGPRRIPLGRRCGWGGMGQAPRGRMPGVIPGGNERSATICEPR